MSTPAPKLIEIRQHSTVYTMAEAAAYLKISKNHLLAIVHGRLPGVPAIQHVKLGRRLLFQRSWLDAFLDRAATR